MNIEELEKLRKEARNRAIISFFVILVPGIIVIIISKMYILAGFFFGLGLILANIIGNSKGEKFIKEYKKTFVLKSLEETFDNLVYEPNKGLDQRIIAMTQMMDMGDRYASNDYVSGTYKNINVVQADVHIEEEQTYTDSDGDTHTTWVTLFLGRWMIFDFNKEFKANIQVCEKGFSNARVTNRFGQNKFQKIQMEDAEFNKKFRIYAQSEHDAFYILTPSLMEKLKTLESKTKGKILLCFVNNKLHVGIDNNKDSFEHSIFKKINVEKELEEVSRDIKLITSFIDDLNLDNDLFKRREV